MGVGSFVWGALSDRLGTRGVVLLGGVLVGAGTMMASRADTVGWFQLVFGAAGFASTLGMALGPLARGWLHDAAGSYAWLFIGSTAVGLGAVVIALTFRPPRAVPAALPNPAVAG
jgi:MFS family permease